MRHVIDKRPADGTVGRLTHFLRIERGSRPWNRTATDLCLRRKRDPAGRTLSQFTAIARGRQV